MHIKNESLKQYTERIKVIFQRCQHKCEVSLFTKHTINVAEVALQTHKEDKSGTPGKAAEHQQEQGKGWFGAGHPHCAVLNPAVSLTIPLPTGMRGTRECEHHVRALHGIPLGEKSLLLLFTSLLAFTLLQPEVI